MIDGALITENPFATPGVFWCEARFAVTDANAVQHSGFNIALPPQLSTAVPKRRCEFLAGRLCAAHALQAVGLRETVGQDGRLPVWPAGAVGSISHSTSQAVAVVSRQHRGLGVDIEPIMTPVHAQEIADLILTPSDQTLRPDGMPPHVFLTLGFSAKESLYKALSAQISQMPTFHDAILLGVSDQSVTLRLGDITLIAGYFFKDGNVFTLVAQA